VWVAAAIAAIGVARSAQPFKGSERQLATRPTTHL